jgi:antitoxin component of MazEF toxin-antitoxin module
MPNVKRLSRLGNSMAVIIDRPFLQQLNLGPESEVEVSLEQNAIVIRPHRYATDAEADASAVRMFKKYQKPLKGLAKR